MNKKDLAEIKRRFHLEHNNITCIQGCYVNNQGEPISTFVRYLQGMAQEEAEKNRKLAEKQANQQLAADIIGGVSRFAASAITGKPKA